MKRVLVIEDNEFDTKLIQRVLEELPVEIDLMHVEDGQEALDFTEAWQPLNEFFDLVLLDSKVPGADGLEVLQALRRVDPQSRVPIVLLVGASGDDFSDQAMGYGADACVVKPLEPKMFVEKVKRIAHTWLELG